ncbi:hypothetical protein Tcan_00569, partial [Toxocara canis]
TQGSVRIICIRVSTKHMRKDQYEAYTQGSVQSICARILDIVIDIENTISDIVNMNISQVISISSNSSEMKLKFKLSETIMRNSYENGRSCNEKTIGNMNQDFLKQNIVSESLAIP